MKGLQSKRETLDIISKFQMTDENHITKLLSIKNSINDVEKCQSGRT